jgi:hypothetical protein
MRSAAWLYTDRDKRGVSDALKQPENNELDFTPNIMELNEEIIT